MLRLMKPGSVLVDIAIDQGGCSKTSRPTTHHDPVHVEEGITHYCVTNMAGAYARTATQALTKVTARFVEFLAEGGVEGAIKREPAIASGVNVMDWKIRNKAVAAAHQLPFEALKI
jgi:alanine dehydrogenase